MIQKGNAGVPPASSSQSGQDARAPLKLPPLTDEPGCAETISSDEMFVQILDPATGTATFLVEVIDVIHNHLQSLWKKRGAAAMPSIPNSKSNIQNWSDFWNTYVPKALLPRLHAYELMMAPYAIAHMKIGLKLAETGYRFETEERARIYLTNALEKSDDKQAKLIGFDALAHEAEAVNEIKRHKRFTVILGNPPYSLMSANLGSSQRSLVEDYKFVAGERIQERGALRFEMNLNDDYVKFIRLAQLILEKSPFGVLGIINNHSYLGNPTLRGMRHSLMTSFRHIHLLDLHGNSSKRERCPTGETDENIFDIKQGVSIGFFSRNTRNTSSDGQIGYADLWGIRTDKYSWLSRNGYASTQWTTLLPEAPFYIFAQQDIGIRREYEKLWALPSVMPCYASGVITARDHFVTDFSDAPLLKRMEQFRDSSLSDDWIRENLEVKDNSMWRMSKARREFRTRPINPKLIVDMQYRPFDVRRIYYEENVVFCMRHELMRHMLPGGNIGLITARSNKSAFPDHFFCSNLIVETKCGESTTQSTFFPLFLVPTDGELDLQGEQKVNLNPQFLAVASKLLLKGGDSKANALSIFHYTYAVFHSLGYRKRYAEFLKIDFPRLPLTENLELFLALARLGGELTALHLLKTPKIDKPMTKFVGSSREIVKTGWIDNTVWINAGGKKAATTAGTSGFQGVPEAVWNFHIGGYQVCHKWLKDRKGRALTDEDITQYNKIVNALSETIRLMKEIEVLIEKHGGWPLK